MDTHCRMIMDEYLENASNYDFLKDKVIELLRDVIDKNGIFITGIEGRVKTADSLSGKLELKGSKYASIDDVTDIVGCRVITFYNDEVDRIAAFVENMFIVDWENSVDKRKMLQQDQFGYMSIHYICQIPEGLYHDPERPELNEIKFEIQIRTALQHVWATIYHDTGYKNDVEVPKEYLRKLSRLAGLIEVADDEFQTTRDEISEYRNHVRSLIKGGQFEDIELNGDSFKGYLELKPFDKLNRNIAAINSAEIQPANLFAYLEVLKQMELKTLADMQSFIKRDYEDAFRLAVHQLSGKDIDIISETLGIQNLCLVKILKDGGRLHGLIRFYDMINGKKPRNAKSAERVLAEAEEIGII
ncbi:MAG: (p)ppGpp synthetase [Bacillota bacterium]|nr:(p)ppGpp synthetase [Bacillota bacterium]